MMGFKAKLVKVRCEPEAIVPPLLKKVREISEVETLPMGTEGCRDCEKVGEMVRTVESELDLAGNCQEMDS